MHYLKTALLQLKLIGIVNPEKRISKRFWPKSDRPTQNLNNTMKDVKPTAVTDYHIQGFCDEFDIQILFSKDSKPKIIIPDHE